MDSEQEPSVSETVKKILKLEAEKIWVRKLLELPGIVLMTTGFWNVYWKTLPDETENLMGATSLILSGFLIYVTMAWLNHLNGLR